MADITIVNGVYKPTYNWGAPSCEDMKTIEHLIVGLFVPKVKPLWFHMVSISNVNLLQGKCSIA